VPHVEVIKFVRFIKNEFMLAQDFMNK